MDKYSIVIVGVGGQGTLLASRVLGNVAIKKNYDVKVSEVHGMAQRGGSVVTYVKMGERISSPIIEKGEADIVIAFEQLEALRWVDYLKEDGKLLVNEQKINPMPVITGKEEYPEKIIEDLKKYRSNTISLDAFKIARDCGNIKTVNTVLMGLLARVTDIEREIWIEALRETVPQRAQDVNFRAFEEGYKRG
ncbi:MAG: indolepyruvate oxidoreductase subunit beta [Clostridium sp.]|nr:indolepyruvate oxidoreductase subunit beta [Clostridium sp.]